MKDLLRHLAMIADAVVAVGSQGPGDPQFFSKLAERPDKSRLKSWRGVSARVLESRIQRIPDGILDDNGRRQTAWAPHIVCSFEFDGPREAVVSPVVGEWVYADRSTAKEFVQQLTPGATPEIWINPDNPTEAAFFLTHG